MRTSPDIRVGLLDNIDWIEFTADRDFTITGPDGRSITYGKKESKWRAKVVQSIPGRVIYRLSAHTFSDKGLARRKAKEMELAGFKTEIRPVGRPLMVGNRVVTPNRLYRIYLQASFENRSEAETYRDHIWDAQHTTIARQKVKNALGMIQLTNLETGQSVQSMQLLSIQNASVTLMDIPVGEGFHWEHLENREYPEIVQFELGLDGKLVVINRIPLEIYVQGVVPSEMPEGFPVEALKAQAIAARGKALGGWGIIHQADPYDVCATVHCQVYSGLSRRNPKTDHAVKETAGQVMWSDGKICDSIFGAVCGGHTEDVDKAWGGSPYSYLVGAYDGPDALKKYGPLSVEDNAIKWIENSPPAYCNSVRRNVPKALEYTKKYFRWDVELAQNEVQQALLKRSIDVGQVLSLISEERGVSGRIIRLRISGTEGEHYINGELNIRRALSETTLWSSCFTVRTVTGLDTIPDTFILRGAGWGHGVGMCQTGAAIMALSRKSYRHILKHYYEGIEIKRLY
ncbi:SpoIID/LytB domain-containing protein [candidate division KSB1 bacterium]|nr:SpoIID/LytB domain-containing protein [candidate division KSB1 bacterium]